jgi:glycosyltransferase involved in cell wall biosynthesis
MPDEVIVVDNNSTDNTVKIAKKYKFVKVIPEKNQGIVYARDKGFNSARSEIIARIDADTILPNNWVAVIKEFYSDPKNHNDAWTSSGYFYNVRFSKFSGWVQNQITFRFNRFLLGHYVLWGSTMAINQAQWRTVKKLTCNRNDIHEDLDLAIHLHDEGVNINYDTSINVAVFMRRVLNDRNKLWKYLMLWPATLRVHHMRKWVLSWVGALLLFMGAPLVIVNDKIGKLSENRLFLRLKVRIEKEYHKPVIND